jgi:hypothetical protein
MKLNNLKKSNPCEMIRFEGFGGNVQNVLFLDCENE